MVSMPSTQADNQVLCTVLVERAQQAEHEGNHARARRYYAAAIEANPLCPEPWLARAALVTDPRETLSHLAQVLTLDPGNERAREMLRRARREARNLPGRAAPAVPAVAPSRAPVPRPLVPLGPAPQEHSASGLWGVMGIVLFVVVLALFFWTDAPQTVVAALIPTNTPTPTPTFTPTPTPTPTPTYTPTPTFTPSPTPTPTWTPTPTPSPTSTPKPTPVPADKSESGKWIEVDLSSQRLYAHEGQKTVMTAVVSTGTRYHPTVKGRFKIYAKYRSAPMSGPGYYIPNVRWTMYFYGGYAIHGAHWHNNFGTPMSHGCVNMKVAEAKTLFEWAPKGTLVVVHK